MKNYIKNNRQRLLTQLDHKKQLKTVCIKIDQQAQKDRQISKLSIVRNSSLLYKNKTQSKDSRISDFNQSIIRKKDELISMIQYLRIKQSDPQTIAVLKSNNSSHDFSNQKCKCCKNNKIGQLISTCRKLKQINFGKSKIFQQNHIFFKANSFSLSQSPKKIKKTQRSINLPLIKQIEHKNMRYQEQCLKESSNRYQQKYRDHTKKSNKKFKTEQQKILKQYTPWVQNQSNFLQQFDRVRKELKQKKKKKYRQM